MIGQTRLSQSADTEHAVELWSTLTVVLQVTPTETPNRDLFKHLTLAAVEVSLVSLLGYMLVFRAFTSCSMFPGVGLCKALK